MGYVENQNRNRAQARANFQERYNPLDGVVEAIAKIDRESREAAAKEAERIAAKEKDAKTDARNAATDARAVTAASEVSDQRKFEMDQAKAKVDREQDERAAGQFLDEMATTMAPMQSPGVTLDADGNEVMEITAEELADDMPDGDVDIALKATGARMREGGVSMAGLGSGTIEEFASVVRRIEGEREQAAADRAAKKEKAAADLALVQANEKKALREPATKTVNQQDQRIKVLKLNALEDAEEKRKKSDATPLRKEFDSQPMVKAYKGVSVEFDKMKSAASVPSAPGDLALIFSFMKMLDPTSAVKETEFANAQNATGVPEQIRNQWNKLRDGKRLGDEQRKEFMNQAGGFYSAQKKAYDSEVKRFQELAKRTGVDPENVALAIDDDDVAPADATEDELNATAEQ